MKLAGIQKLSGRIATVVLSLAQKCVDRVCDRDRDGGTDSQISGVERDDLTGLPGRRWLQQRLDAPLRNGWQRGVAVLDLDAFALVNQGYGPDVADRVLQQFAGRLQLLVGRHSLGRWQADEFVCVVDAVRPAEVLEELLLSLPAVTQSAFQVRGDQIRLSLSCGLATSPQVPVRELYRSSSAALDAAKRQGRNRAEWFDRAAHRVLTGGGLRLATDLHRGILEGEMRLHLQPIVELATNDVTGVEALVRWQRPGVGLLRPGSFIDVAERTGQIGPLGAWVAHHACLAAVELAASNVAPITVSINVSARQLSDPGLVQMLGEALGSTGCSPRNLAVEVTETALLHDLAAATAVLEDIKALGVRLDLDDFGTGYSSLLYLKHFPVDRIKIDGSFVQGLGADAADTAIVASTIALAHSIGLTAVAEGVMTSNQMAELRQMDCDFAQGYLLSRPLPLERLHRWLAEQVPSRLLTRDTLRPHAGDHAVDLRDRLIDLRVPQAAARTLDALTGGYRRAPGLAALRDEIERARRRRQTLAVACVDVDDLDSVRDRIGHLAADAMLVAVANALGEALRPSDVLIRQGPGRFVIAFLGQTPSAISRQLASVQAQLSGPPNLANVTCALAHLQHEDTAERLLARLQRVADTPSPRLP